MNLETLFNETLLKKYDKAGPRYTSYPTALQFNTEFSCADYMKEAMLSNSSERALSLYVHIPFCDTVCFYCGCNKIITKNRKHSEPYLNRLYKEIEWQGNLFDKKRVVKQLHWGGGTPTFLSQDEMRMVMQKTAENFTLLDDDQGEYSIEVDPREANTQTIKFLRDLGFNRLSMGVQDFDPKVQKAVNRIQPMEITLETLHAARDCGFQSVSLDLIYGLPHQTVESFEKTLDIVIELSPDRLCVFNYAHLPHLFKMQRQMNEADLPSPQMKIAILKRVIEKLTAANYVYIGMDHFAKPTDELAIAQKNGTLYRNFQGYSTHADCDLVGMGISSISQIGDVYAQNFKEMSDYEANIDRTPAQPIWRGVRLNQDDVLRRHVITQLMCNLKLDLDEIGQQFEINAPHYFAKELLELADMAKDGLVSIEQNRITVLDAGRLLIRNIGMVFDFYLQTTDKNRFSKVI